MKAGSYFNLLLVSIPILKPFIKVRFKLYQLNCCHTILFILGLGSHTAALTNIAFTNIAEHFTLCHNIASKGAFKVRYYLSITKTGRLCDEGQKSRIIKCPVW